MSVDNYINELKNQRDLLADILTEKGVESSRSEKFNTLIPKVRDISGGGKNDEVTGNIEKYVSSISENAQIVNIPQDSQSTDSGTISRVYYGEVENVIFEEE